MLDCTLPRQGKNCECHPAHSLLFIILGGLCFYFIINHARYILRLVRFFYICDVIAVKYLKLHFQFVKNSLHWHPCPRIKNNFENALWGT